MVEKKYWYVVKLNVREVGNDDQDGIIRTEYCLVQGTSYENIAWQLKNVYKPFYEINEYGEPVYLKKCSKIYGTQFETRAKAMDYLMELKYKK